MHDTVKVPAVVTQPAEVCLSERDFTFVNYRAPQQFFQVERPYRVVHSSPVVKEFFDVTYMPPGLTAYSGYLLTDENKVIQEACVIRNVNDTNMSTDGLDLNGHQFDDDGSDRPFYERPLLYLGHLNPHYGHFLLESLSCWWPLVAEKYDVDGYLIHVQNPESIDLPYIQTCLSALEIDKDKLIYFDRPTRLRKVIVPQPSFQIHSHVFHKYRELCATIVGRTLGKEEKVTEQPLYVSRRLFSSNLSDFRGEEYIEEFLSKRGVRIIHPQELSFVEQIQVYNQHSHIIGLHGSGLLNIAFALQPTTMVSLTSHYIASNFFLINKCFDVNSTYVQACTKTDRLRWFLHRTSQKVLHRNNAAQQSSRVYDLDHKRVIKWLTDAGY